MDLSRRQFFKVAGIGLAGSSLGALGMAPTIAFAEQVRHFKLAHTHETRNTCPYCSVGCGLIMYSQGDAGKNVAQISSTSRATPTTGQPRHPLPKAGPAGLHSQPAVCCIRRRANPQQRMEGSWDEALDRIVD